MNFSITFENTGDSIGLTAINPELLEYYVENLNQTGTNTFSFYRGPIRSLPQVIDELQTLVQQSQEYLTLIDCRFDIFSSEEYLNQQVLNKLHADWVNTQHKLVTIAEQRHTAFGEQLHHMYPDDINVATFGSILSKLNFDQSYGKINTLLHNVESSFTKIDFKTDAVISINNPFDKTMATNNIANFGLTFRHLGRTLYNKFFHFDEDLEHNDENTFDELLGYVSFQLVKPQTIQFSNEYIAWCQRHNKMPTGDHLNLGNIPDIDKNLTKYRTIFYRNIQSNNNFKIQLHE